MGRRRTPLHLSDPTAGFALYSEGDSTIQCSGWPNVGARAWLSPTLAADIDRVAFLQPDFGTSPVDYDANTTTPPWSNGSPSEEPQSADSRKRKEPPLPTGSKPVKKTKAAARRSGGKGDAVTQNGDAGKDGGDGAHKPKRVRTGCLTCRERHLKCDEGMPDCNNCVKSNRVCKRGLKLNFLDIWTKQPPVMDTSYGTHSWKVEFLDESRDIASEYQGGMQKYKPLQQEMPAPLPAEAVMPFEYIQNAPPPPSMAHQPLPLLQTSVPDIYHDPTQHSDLNSMFDGSQYKSDTASHHQLRSHSAAVTSAQYSVESSHSSIAPGSVGSYNAGQLDLLQSTDNLRKDYLDNPQETLYMQVFVEEVGLWMDSMDPHKHFSRLLPFHSLSEPMLLNAFLACGARHLTLVNPQNYKDETALNYYDTATSHLLKSLQDPNRDTVICATTAVILNVYEIMSERALQRMNHIAGARALIKECGWNARARGIGAACFWLNVGLEVLSCLHFNWQVAWNPDKWGVDMDFSRELENGREEIWTHRMLYIIARVCNFRATSPSKSDPHAHMEHSRVQQRMIEWTELHNMAKNWNNGIPRTMHPMAYVYPFQTITKSAFPEIWLVKRSTIVARLFYHTALLLLSQNHPYFDTTNGEMQEMQRHHAQQICGIAAHVKDRGVASVAIRGLAHAGEVLTLRHEQEEVLQIFSRINTETGWRVGYVYGELKEKWGWNEGPSPEEFAQTHTAAIERKQQEQQYLQQQQHTQTAQMRHPFDFDRSSLPPLPPPPPQQQLHVQPLSAHGHGHVSPSASAASSTPVAPSKPAGKPGAMRKMPQGIPNPMYAKADFSLPQHPYQNFYVAPNHVNDSWGGQLYYSF